MRKINVDPFDKQSILKAVEELDEYYQELECKCVKLVSKMADHGAEIARVIIQALPYSTDDLASKIYAFYDEKEKCAFIKADSKHAVFVEFGTGLVGEGTYTNSDYLAVAEKFGWQGYDVGGFGGREFYTKDGRRGWITVMNNGHYYFTEGQEAKHFMDNAGRDLVENFEDYVRGVFKNND